MFIKEGVAVNGKLKCFPLTYPPHGLAIAQDDLEPEQAPTAAIVRRTPSEPIVENNSNEKLHQ
jgi:hypothetical protein